MQRKQYEEKKLLEKKDRLANELSIMKRLHNISTRFVSNDRSQDLLSEIVETAVIITDADMGNIQLFDEQSNSLKIVAHNGFKQPFLDFFNTVHLGQAACGAAMDRKKRVIIEDVTKSPIFMGTPSLDVMLAAGARAVQSTPLFSRSGRLMGMLSTHYKTLQHPDEQDLQLLDMLARQTADIIERTQIEQDLRENEEHLAQLNALLAKKNSDLTAIIEGISDSFYALDNEWRITYASKSFVKTMEGFGFGADCVGVNILKEFPQIVETRTLACNFQLRQQQLNFKA